MLGDSVVAKDVMVRCQEKRLHKIDGKKQFRWVEIAVADISIEGGKEIRCMHCKGEVKVVKQKTASSPPLHVDHRSRVDTDHCQGDGAQQQSSNPVL
jgi:hypothetical protein